MRAAEPAGHHHATIETGFPAPAHRAAYPQARLGTDYAHQLRGTANSQRAASVDHACHHASYVDHACDHAGYDDARCDTDAHGSLFRDHSLFRDRIILRVGFRHYGGPDRVPPHRSGGGWRWGGGWGRGGGAGGRGQAAAAATTAPAAATTAPTVATIAPAVAAPSPNSAQATAAAKEAIRQFMAGHHTNQPVKGHSKKVSALTQVQSGNWSGYADTGSGFTNVSSSWTEPTPSCGGSGGDLLAAFWVGIDGYNSSSVEQDGTMIQCYNGTAYQYSWWEMYPTNAVQIVGRSVAAGDKITASVSRRGSTYALKVADSTHRANSLTETKTRSGLADSSAESIAEAPSGSGSVYPLAKFSTWVTVRDVVSTSYRSGHIGSFTDYEITMVDSAGRVKAQPGPLNSGTSFPVTWKAST